MDGRDGAPPAGWADVPVAIERFVVRRWDGTGWPVQFERALCVEVEGEQKRGYIVGNAHTHRGRFRACFPDGGYVATLSAYQLTAVSAEALYWLRGFLTGTEPSIHEYLGRVDTEDYHEPTAEEWTRFDAFIEEYLRWGSSTRARNRPKRALVATDEERAGIRLDPWRPWAYVGERVLVPDGAGWVEADPQPEMDGDFLGGSVCAERGHELMGLDSGWLVCRDCGDAQETP